jgi:hypothetical protein
MAGEWGGGATDLEVWGFVKVTYNFKDLVTYVENGGLGMKDKEKEKAGDDVDQKKEKGKRKVRDEVDQKKDKGKRKVRDEVDQKKVKKVKRSGSTKNRHGL